MELDLEESWLDNCGASESQSCDDQLLHKDIPAFIPEISERDVVNEIEKLTASSLLDNQDSVSNILLPEGKPQSLEKPTYPPEPKEEEDEPDLPEFSDNIDTCKEEEKMETLENGIGKNEETSKEVNLEDKIDSNQNERSENDQCYESGEDHDSGEGDSEDHESGDEQVSAEDQEENEDDETSSKVSGSSEGMSPKLSHNEEELTFEAEQKATEEDFIEEEDGTNILEPTCELAVSDDFEQSYKSRFNLRKRSHVQTSNDFSSDIDEEEMEEPETEVPVKKIKFNFQKKNYRRQRPYTNEAVKEAVKMVHSKKMSILEASRQYDIPRTSLHNFVRLYKRGRRMGVRTISPGLTKQEEEEMVSLVIKLSRCGKRYSHNELRYLIQYYLVNNDRPVFKSGTLPTMGWIAGLVERQPELIKAKSKKNTKVAVEDVEEWQRQIEDYLINDWDLDIEEIFKHENGHRIFCFNAFKMTVNGPAENSENKPPVKKEPGVEEEKDQEMSVILGMSAAGSFVAPYVVFMEENRDTFPDYEPKLRFLFNKTGRVDEDVALRVVRDFDEEIVHKGVPKPVVFFVNDKQDLAHFSVIEYCWENQIVIICLPPKTCKTMTPFEVSIWPKIRSCYATLWKNSPKNFDNKLSVDQFPELFIKAWDSASVPKQAVRGFSKSGLIPLDVPAILGEPVGGGMDQMDDYSQSQLIQEPMEDSLPDELSSLEERSRGKLEGIQMCLEAIETFIPPDIMPIWNERGADYRGRCELAFKLWRSVSLLLKAGCAMASIQQMADGFFNPFSSDFSSTSAFFQKTPLPNAFSDSRPESPLAIEAPLSSGPEKPTPKKRKLNKSIYSRSEASVVTNTNGEESKKPKSQRDTPFVKLYQNPFTMQDEIEGVEES